MLRYRLYTYGCQMNERDSLAIEAMLQDLGYLPAEPGQPEDLVIFNTCCVRESAERKIIGRIFEYRQKKAERPEMIVGVGGCMTQQPGAGEKLARRAPWLDLVYGTHNLARLPALLAAASARRRLRADDRPGFEGPLVEVQERPGPVAESRPRAGPRGVTAFVNVSYGCNNYCTYCIVPYVRGPERSRPVRAVVEEVVALASAGVREITLLGQNVNSYGRDLPGSVDFARLLCEVDAAGRDHGLARVRFLTSHPKDLTDRLIEAMAVLPAVCEHIHLPFQAGSDRILAAMHRGYTRRHYLALIDRLRSAIPEIGLTTDIIVGFPGETEAEFEDTLDVVRQAQFDSAFTFAFSPRTGTPAAEFPDQVPQEVRRRRLATINRLQEEVSRRRMARLRGTVREVLFSERSTKDPEVLGGRTRAFQYVLTPAGPEYIGRLGRVKIERTRTWTVSARLEQAGEDDCGLGETR